EAGWRSAWESRRSRSRYLLRTVSSKKCGEERRPPTKPSFPLFTGWTSYSRGPSIIIQESSGGKEMAILRSSIGSALALSILLSGVTAAQQPTQQSAPQRRSEPDLQQSNSH